MAVCLKKITIVPKLLKCAFLGSFIDRFLMCSKYRSVNTKVLPLVG